MQDSSLFGIAGFLALACFITVYFARKWPNNRRYGLLVIGNVLVVLAAYFDPWWRLGERDDRRDLIMWLVLNAFLIPRIVRDGKAAQPSTGDAPTGVNSASMEPPPAALIALVLTAMFFVWAISHHSTVRTLVLGGLLATTGIATYTHKQMGKPSRTMLIGLAFIVLALAAVARFGHSPWISSFFSTL